MDRTRRNTSNSHKRFDIEIDYSYLGEGQSLAGEPCPKCGGGSSKESTLSVSRRDGILLWYCHRDSCGFRGAAAGGRVSSRSDFPEESSRGIVGRTFLRTADSIPAEVTEELAERYSITASHISKWSLGWDSESSRLVLPVLSSTGEARGSALRSFSGALPKVKTHTEQGAMAWFTNVRTGGVIIVEDQLSAIRASDYITSVALLGTHLNEERVQEIKASKLSPVYLALDNDAISTAVKHVVKYRSVLPMKLLRLERDIKDLSYEEADRLFASIGASRV